MYKHVLRAVMALGVIAGESLPAAAQTHSHADAPVEAQTSADPAPVDTSASQPPDHQHMHMSAGSTWQLMQDGTLFVELNHQPSARGGDELVAPNWWMGMAMRNTSHGRLMLTSMFSLDAATVGESGYREILQVGEALNGRPLIDRQHPHDAFMQLSAAWRIPLGEAAALTIAGAPVGEPALGPVAFMHRASAMDNPTAPLGHHTFDSTHVAFGVLTAGIDRARWTVEGSVFNGREPDQNRWDFDFGPLDSVSARIWFRPTPNWELQASTGHLTSPEELESGNIERSTISAAWTRTTGNDALAMTVGYGRNDTDTGNRQAFFIEGARRFESNTMYARFEALQVETALLETDRLVSSAAQAKDPVVAFTVGGVRDVLRAAGLEGGVGADLTLYGVPSSLQSVYGAHPVSFHVFFRVRPRAGSMGRMWNTRMSRP